jgi:threonine aldolase
VTTIHDRTVRGFASDNYSGIHPDILAAIAAANEGHQVAYGEDVYTARLQEVMAEHFGAGVEAFPVFNGTGANVTGLQSMLPRWGAVVAASTAHINTDEGGAPERVAGIKILGVPTDDGKLTPALIDREAWGWGDEHRAQPLVVSITQSTELGTLYTPDEIRAIADHIHPLGMRLHLDGSRIANAAAALDLPLRAFTRDAGVDVLSLGGTKNGAMVGEAVVVLDPDASIGLKYLRKLNMQLSSKMRFVSAQLVALFEGDLWLRNAQHSNAMAARLRAGVEAGLADGSIRGVGFTQQTQVNGVFATLPPGVADRLRESFRFYDWDASKNEVRWMCSFDTTEEDIDAFIAAIARETSA